MKIDYMNFYENFVKLCNERDMKPSRAGIEAGVPKQTVSNWKKGTRPGDTHIVKLSKYFNVPMDYFYKIDSEEPKKESPDQMTEAELDNELIEIWKSGDENEHRALLEMARLIKSRRGTK